MSKVIDLNKTVFELITEYPEMKDIMIELGFQEITNPTTLKTMGKIITIPKGAKINKIPMDKIISSFTSKGFEVKTDEKKVTTVEVTESNNKNELLKSYIQRLTNGEDLESVRKEFVKYFESVSVHEIIGAEQDLINSGVDVEEIQKLCDLHSALFHGLTEQELYNEEEMAAHGLQEGHPLNILKNENKALASKLLSLLDATENNNVSLIQELLTDLKRIKLLYGKKEEIIMPILYRYGVTDPSDVMWGVDDEIKAEFSELAKEVNEETFPSYRQRILDVLERAKEMIYKEENILFPMALEYFTLEEWVDVYHDLPEMGNIFTKEAPVWEYAEQEIKRKKNTSTANNDLIQLNGGKLTVSQLEAIFKLLPIDITFIDQNDHNQFFANEGKVFSRPSSALGRPVYECHPPRIVPIVKQLIKDFKSGEKDFMEVWTPNPDNPIRVQYYAVRDGDGTYLGTVELVQQMKDIQTHILEIAKTAG
ncbi:MAG: DUF438 domain-containing protein [Solobacterium sp.]|nr:DUF438 domain-containing protein [Solobacterium sp.]